MHSTLAGKKIVFGVTGSIAAFKAAGWVSRMAQEEAVVDVVMTETAVKFVTPVTFASLTGRKVLTDMFSAEEDGVMSHIELGRESDCIIVAPATAQTIARLARGFADDLITTAVLAARKPVIVCPAMNVNMYEHPATKYNISKLKQYGYTVVSPGSGMLACGDEGSGRLPEYEVVRQYLLRAVSKQDLVGQKVLVTAGPTRENYDPARFISNRSSGKMGFAIANAAFRRGAEVTLVSGPVSIDFPAGINCISVYSAQEMYDTVLKEFKSNSVIVKTAAVSDFRCAEINREKVKKEKASLTMQLTQNKDILKKLGELRDPDKQVLVGFAAESSNIEKEGKRKLLKKKLDLIAVNDISSTNSGFAVDSNQLVLIDKQKSFKLPHTSKIKTADLLWDYLLDEGMLKECATS